MAGSIIWNAPNLQQIGNVAPGCVVMVQARLVNPSDFLNPSSAGVVPHVRYTASVPPIGTGGSTLYDPYDGRMIDYNNGPMPTSVALGDAPSDNFTYDVDLGCPFPCPWAGTISLVGGATIVPGTTVPMNVSIVRTGPSDRPIENPTITFRKVPDNANLPVPRGAKSVTAGRGGQVSFSVWGVSGGETLLNMSNSGFPSALGDFSMGTFSAALGSTLPQISFYIQIG